MIIAQIIKNHINYQKCMKAHVLNYNVIAIDYILPVKRHIEDKLFVKEFNKNNTFVRYYNSKQKISRSVVYDEIYGFVKDHPVSNSDVVHFNRKYFISRKEYKIEDLIKLEGLYNYLHKEREECFKEIKSIMVLEEIQDLTKKYDILTDNNHFNKLMQYNHDQDNKKRTNLKYTEVLPF
jgi:hypothetical protein